jgi:hypothetical protein
VKAVHALRLISGLDAFQPSKHLGKQLTRLRTVELDMSS